MGLGGLPFWGREGVIGERVTWRGSPSLFDWGGDVVRQSGRRGYYHRKRKRDIGGLNWGCCGVGPSA